MKINKVIINNFRNIIHAEYDLTLKNVFAGPNRRGKTNTIIAIYWCLSEAILGGSNDYTSFKPLYDPSKEASVELIFDSFEIKKVYRQIYTKDKPTGNTTDYWINDEPTPQREALRKIKKLLGSNRELEADKVDLTQVLSDPYYLSEKLDYKLLRKFVIELIGDIDDEDVIVTDASFEDVRVILKKHGFDTVKAAKELKDKINVTEKEVNDFRSQIKGLERVQDIDPEILTRSKSELQESDLELAKLNQSKLTMINPNIARVQSEISTVQLELSKSMNADRGHLEKQNAVFNNRSIPLNDKVKNLNEVMNVETRKLFSSRSAVSIATNEVLSLNSKLEAIQGLVASKRKEWADINTREFKSLAHVVEPSSCPHCGGVLNQDSLDKQAAREAEYQEKFEKTKMMDLDTVVKAGKKANEDAVNYSMLIAEKQKELEVKSEELGVFEIAAKEMQASVNSLQDEITSISFERMASYESDKTKELRSKLVELQAQVVSESTINHSANVDTRIHNEYSKQEELKRVIGEHQAFIASQQNVKIIKVEIENKQDFQTQIEGQFAMVNNFMKVKLELIKLNAEKVFGTRITLTLIESNIEGEGWQQVCYFSVLDKDTKFKNGSGSEKILTGIYLIECVKRHLGLDNLPIIFDECDKLDSASIAGLETTAQIITTKVDDQNYKDVTLLSI